MSYDENYSSYNSNFNLKKDLSEMVGSTLLSANKFVFTENDAVKFVTTKGVWILHHIQDCCESVSIKNFDGLGDDFNPGEVIVADVRVSTTNEREDESMFDQSVTFTDYVIRTTGSDIDIDFVGSSNGYYSEAVDITYRKLTKEDLKDLSPKALVVLDKLLENGLVLDFI